MNTASDPDIIIAPSGNTATRLMMAFAVERGGRRYSTERTVSIAEAVIAEDPFALTREALREATGALLHLIDAAGVPVIKR